MSCSIPSCHNTDKNISYHEFPSNPTTYCAWIRAITISENSKGTPTTNVHPCILFMILHFDSGDFNS